MFGDEVVFDQWSESLAHHDYVVIDHFIQPDAVAGILEGMKDRYQQRQFKKAGIGHLRDFRQDDQVRGDSILWIEPEQFQEVQTYFLPPINQFVTYLNQRCFLSLQGYEMHYAVYPEGSFYTRHLDQLSDNSNRILTFICYLNQNWTSDDGGALRIYLNSSLGDETFIDVLPEAGRLVCFKSNLLEHEVLPTKRERFSLTGWLLTRPKIFNV